VGLAAVEQGLTLTKDREVVDTPTSVTSDLGARLVVYSATAAYALIFIAGRRSGPPPTAIHSG